MARKKGSKDYPKILKMQAIRMVLEEGRPYAEITEALGVRDPERVQHWVSQYRRGGEAAFSKPRRGRPRKTESREAYIKQLEMENTLLKALRIELGENLPGGLDTE